MATASREFAESMVVLAEAFGAKLTEQRIRIYAELLSDVPIEDLRRGIYKLCRERDARFQPADPEARLPPVSEILRYVRPTEDDAALVAWTTIKRLAEDVGPHMSVRVDDDATAFAIARVFGGWPDCCDAIEEGPALAQRRQEFLTAYRYARRHVDLTVNLRGSRFPGICEGSGSYPSDSKLMRVWYARLTAEGDIAIERDSREARSIGTAERRMLGGAVR